MSAIESLFDVYFDEEITEAEAEAEKLLDVVIRVQAESSSNNDDLFSVCVLTVPDVARFPLPARYSIGKVAVDLAGLAELSGGEVRKLIQPELPDDQLLEIGAAEKLREKPRQMVLAAVTSEKLARDMVCDSCGQKPESFSDWVSRVARNPLSCRIAAIAWRAGESAEVVSFAPASLEEEAAALADLRVAWSQWTVTKDHIRGKNIGAWDAQQVMRIVFARRLYVGIDCQHSDFNPSILRSAVEWWSWARDIGGLAQVAAALGIAAHEIPHVLTDLEVYQQFTAEPGSLKLVDAAASQLQLERDLLQVLSTLY